MVRFALPALAVAVTLVACSRSPSRSASVAEAPPAATFGVSTATATPTPSRVTDMATATASPSPTPAPTASPPPSPAATPAPGPAARAIRTTDWPRIVAAELRVDGAQGSVRADTVRYVDLTGDGVEEAIVPIEPQGNAGVIGYYVFAVRDGTVVRLLARRGPEIHMSVTGGRLVESIAVRAAGDPRCCPSHVQRTTFAWTGTEFSPLFVEVVPNPNR